ncbi:Cytidylate kinase [Mycolicibacterium aubagnense]
MSTGLAHALGANHIDTGAMYRIVTLAVLRAGIDPADADAVVSVCEKTDFSVSFDPDHDTSYLASEDVSNEIRGDAVTLAVSAVSAIPAVRSLLVQRQRELIAAAGSVVIEGRDIGTVVKPDTDRQNLPDRLGRGARPPAQCAERRKWPGRQLRSGAGRCAAPGPSGLHARGIAAAGRR